MEQNKPRSVNHEIINKFLNIEKSKNDKYFWPRETKLTKKLLSTFPIEFFRFCKELPFKLPSLAWFLTPNGKKFLNSQYFEYKKSISNLTEERKEIEILPNKIGEDIQVSKKPKTLKDFLNLYKNNYG